MLSRSAFIMFMVIIIPGLLFFNQILQVEKEIYDLPHHIAFFFPGGSFARVRRRKAHLLRVEVGLYLPGCIYLYQECLLQAAYYSRFKLF